MIQRQLAFCSYSTFDPLSRVAPHLNNNNKRKPVLHSASISKNGRRAFQERKSTAVRKPYASKFISYFGFGSVLETIRKGLSS
jgi:hypothetical protein